MQPLQRLETTVDASVDVALPVGASGKRHRRWPRIELLELLADARLWRGPLLAVLVLMALADWAVIQFRAAIAGDSVQPNSAPAHQGAAADDPRTAGRPVRYDWSIGDRFGEFLPFVPDARSNRLVILSGMSQMYTMNEYRPGDETIAEHLDDLMAPRGVRVFGLAAPNLSNEEALFLLLATLQSPRTRPASFVYGLAFEKLREADVRPQYREYLREHPALQALWREAIARYGARYPLAAQAMRETLASTMNPSAGRDEHSFEARLRRRVSEVVPLVQARQDLNRHFRETVFLVRNWIFHVTTATKRPLIPARYDMNRQFLGLLVDMAREQGVQVVLYNVPFNPRVENPYIPREYAAFKGWFAGFCRERGVPYADLENVVPPQDWGNFMGGPDFMHFKGEGHRLVAAELARDFGGVFASGQGESGR